MKFSLALIIGLFGFKTLAAPAVSTFKTPLGNVMTEVHREEIDGITETSCVFVFEKKEFFRETCDDTRSMKIFVQSNARIDSYKVLFIVQAQTDVAGCGGQGNLYVVGITEEKVPRVIGTIEGPCAPVIPIIGSSDQKFYVIIPETKFENHTGPHTVSEQRWLISKGELVPVDSKSSLKVRWAMTVF